MTMRLARPVFAASLLLGTAACLDGRLTGDGGEGTLEVAQTVEIAGTPGLRFERRRLGDGAVRLQVVNRTGRAIDTLVYAHGTRVPGQSGSCTSPVPIAATGTATAIAAGARATLAANDSATSLVPIRVRFADGSGSPSADGRWRGTAQVAGGAPLPIDGDVRLAGVAAFVLGAADQYRAAPGVPLATAPAVLQRERFNCYLFSSLALTLDTTEPVRWGPDSIVGTWRDADGVPHRLRLARSR